MIAPPPQETWDWLVERALDEDIGSGDATSLALIPEDLRSAARLETRERIHVCGLPMAAAVFRRRGADVEVRAPDGSRAEPGTVLAVVTGPARALLEAERTAVNFMQHLSGIATLTARFVEAVRGTRARILDTRKTTPGWRHLEKYAVRCGGGTNHRAGLYDAILIKDNHLAAVGSVSDAVKRARESGGGLQVQIEVESEAMAREALEAGADLLLVDNRPPEEIARIVELVGGRVPVEATGGVDLRTVAEIARTGVDRISIGALTHSAPAVDVALEWIDHSSS